MNDPLILILQELRMMNMTLGRIADVMDEPVIVDGQVFPFPVPSE